MEQNTNIATLPPSERAIIALGSSKAEVQLRELAGKYTAITNVIDSAGRAECHRAAMELKNARLAVDKTGKAARADATAFSNAVVAEAKRLIAIITPEEERLFAVRDAYDAEQARIKAEAERKEAERVAAIRKRIDAIRNIPAGMAGLPSSEIQAEIAAFEAFHADDSFAEFADEANAVVASTVQALIVLRDKQLAAEAEAARLAAEREELARLRAAAEEHSRQVAAQNAERERAAAEERRQMDAEREALEAERRAFAEQQKKAREEQEAALRAEEERVAAAAAKNTITLPPIPYGEQPFDGHYTMVTSDDAGNPVVVALDAAHAASLAYRAPQPATLSDQFGTAMPAYHEPQPAPEPLTITYDAGYDVLTVEGIRYAGDLFRQFGRFAKPGTVFQFVERNDGVVTLVNVDSVAA